MHPDDRYRRAAAAGGVGIWDWNIVTGEVYIDRVLKEMLGYQDDEIPNTADVWHRLVHPDDKAALVAWSQANIAGDSLQHEFEHRMLHRDGSVRWFLVRASVTRDASGAAIHMAGTDTDITARKRGEEALRQAEEINRRIAESTGDCVKILDLTGRIIYINPEGLRQLELEDAGALLNAPLEGPLEGESRLAAREAIEAARGGGTGRFQFDASNRVRGVAVVRHRADADHGCERQRRAAACGLARYHGTTPGRGVSRHAASGARDDRDRQRRCLTSSTFLSGSSSSSPAACGARCCCSTTTASMLRQGAAPSLPEEYVRAIDGMPIGPRIGSCGTAMFLGTRIIVTDILHRSALGDYRDVARRTGCAPAGRRRSFRRTRRCSARSRCTATSRARPATRSSGSLRSAADVAGIAIEQQRAQEALRHSEARNSAILRAIPDWMFLTTVEGVFLDCHARDPRTCTRLPLSSLDRTSWTCFLLRLAQTLVQAFERAARSDEPEKVEYATGLRRQRALLRSVHRALRRRQDPQHRPGHHRSQARGAGSQRAAPRDWRT